MNRRPTHRLVIGRLRGEHLLEERSRGVRVVCLQNACETRGGKKRYEIDCIVSYVPDGLTTREAARRLGSTPPTVRRLLDAGLIQGDRLGDDRKFRWVISRSSLDEFIEQFGMIAGRRNLARNWERNDQDGSFQIRDLTENAQTPAFGQRDLRREREELRSALGIAREMASRGYRIAELQRDADSERAVVVSRLLEAIEAGERADALRRQALSELTEILTSVTMPAHPGAV